MANNIYPYLEQLIREGNKLLEKKDFSGVFGSCLIIHNHGHSGWTEEVERIYSKPKNDEEVKYSQKLKEIILKTANGFLNTEVPMNDIFKFMNIEALAVCLVRLGDKSTEEMRKRTRKLIQKSQELADPEILPLMRRVEEYLLENLQISFE